MTSRPGKETKPAQPDIRESALRYTAAFKAQIVLAIRESRLSRFRAMQEHALSAEELKSWETAFARGSVKALRVRAIRR